MLFALLTVSWLLVFTIIALIWSKLTFVITFQAESPMATCVHGFTAWLYGVWFLAVT